MDPVTYSSADQRTRNAATRCVLHAYNATKCDCGRSSAPDPSGELTALPQTSYLVLGGCGGEGARKEEKGMKKRGRKWEARCREGGDVRGGEVS